MSKIKFFTNSAHLKLAYHENCGKTDAPTVIFLSGYRSDMQGTKASYLADLAQEHDFNFLRFDYSGHGISQGDFKELTLSDWIEDSAQIIEHVYGTQKKLILVGSSMGGWIAIKLFKRLLNPISHFIGLAPAPDFSNRLMKDQLELPEFKSQLNTQGFIQSACDYEGEDFIITQKFLLDADQNAVLDQEINFEGYVHILQGMQDQEVPYEHAILLANQLTSKNVTVEFRKTSDHRLSSEADLERLKYILTSNI